MNKVRVYRRVLTASEVTSVYQQPDLEVGTGGGGYFYNPSGTCSSIVESANPSLLLINDLLPKGSDGYNLPEYPANYITLHRDYVTTDPDTGGYQRGTVQLNFNNVTTASIKNRGTSTISITSITVADPSLFTVSGLPSSYPTSLFGGQSLSFTIAFIGNSTDKTVMRTNMTVLTNDASVNLTVVLAGIYMEQPEGGHEVTLQSIISAFGYGINTGVQYVNNQRPYTINWDYSNTLPEEINAQYWTAADSSQPVTVRQLAAFGGVERLDQAHQFEIVYDKTGATDCGQQVTPLWDQTIRPRCNPPGGVVVNNGAVTVDCSSTCNPGTQRFYFRMDRFWTSVRSVTKIGGNPYLDNQITFRFFPIRLSNGTAVPNSYIVCQDYSLNNGCDDNGSGFANCDYQDNVWVITNLSPSDDTVGGSSTVNLPISYSFNSPTYGNPTDQNGNGVPFPDRFGNVNDTHINLVSSDPSKLYLNSAQSTFTITTSPGSVSPIRFVNAMRVNINNQRQASIAVQATFNARAMDSSAYAGVTLGSDQLNMAVFYYHGGKIYFTVQTQTGSQTAPAILPTFTTVTSSPFVLDLANIPQLSFYSNITLILIADPADGTVSASLTGPGIAQSTVVSTYTLPGIANTFGIGPAGRIAGNGVGAGIVAWNDAGSSSTNVNFYNFAASYCGNGFIDGTTSSMSGTTNNNNNPAGTGTTTVTNGANIGATIPISLFLVVSSLFLML